MNESDRALGMHRPIKRRDFVAGVSAVVGGAMVTPRITAPAMARPLQVRPGDAENYPPLRTGMRGAHPGAFEAAHRTRDGANWEGAEPVDESYDAIVVGGGLSGLAAAYFYRQMTGPEARILILDSHDDFGGHAKRNEFERREGTLISNGGSSYMVRPVTFPAPVMAMLRDIGVELDEPTNVVDSSSFRSRGMVRGTFFDRETFGENRLVTGGSLSQPTREFLARAPLSERVRADLLRLYTGEDYLAGMSKEEKEAYLQRISYRDYLLDVAKVQPEVLTLVGSVWALSQDTASAWFAFYRGGMGFEGLGLTRPPFSPERSEEGHESVSFPAGNSDIARLIVRSLIPSALPAGRMADVILDRVGYSRLDEPSSPVRIRLNSLAVQVEHLGEAPVGRLRTDDRETEVTYVRAGKLYRVRSKGTILAGDNAMIPYICAELPEEQREALLLTDRAVNMMTTVSLRTWESFERLGITGVDSPGMFYNTFNLRTPRHFGAYRPRLDPAKPALVGLQSPSGVLHHRTMVRELFGGNPPVPGTPLREQLAALRTRVLRTLFEDFERRIRKQLARVLSPGGFDPARDIEAITINRWPHGFAMGTNALFDPAEWTGESHPAVVGRQRLGRITIANSDAAGLSLAQAAMDEGYRAATELVPRNYGYFNEI
ncbi:MAG TPA: NAD(P)-binding protein [Acidobacteriota bacterium]|nr:NAD(P)-binding protein [Acidobacteriota bacterium]